MAEYIKREAIIGELDEMISNISFTSPYVYEIDRMIEGMERARDCLYNAETADVVEVVHGRWVVTKEHNDLIDMDVVKYTCSACGEYRLSATTLSQATNYCPNCGARMDGE